MTVQDQVNDKIDEMKKHVKEDLDDAKGVDIDWKKVAIIGGSAIALAVGGVAVYQLGIKPRMIAKAASEVAPEIVDAVVETAPEVAEAVL